MKIINVTLTLFPWKGLEEAEDAAYKKELRAASAWDCCVSILMRE